MSSLRFVLGRLARDRSALIGLVLILGLVVAALLAPVLATHPDDLFELHPAKRLRPPSADVDSTNTSFWSARVSA